MAFKTALLELATDAFHQLTKDVTVEDVKATARTFLQTADDTQTNVNVAGAFGAVGYLVLLALVIAILAIVASGRDSSTWGRWTSFFSDSSDQYSGYDAAGSSYTAYRALEDAHKKYATDE